MICVIAHIQYELQTWIQYLQYTILQTCYIAILGMSHAILRMPFLVLNFTNPRFQTTELSKSKTLTSYLPVGRWRQQVQGEAMVEKLLPLIQAKQNFHGVVHLLGLKKDF